MRLAQLYFLAVACSLSAEEAPAKPGYPLWDGHESVADYAKKVKLPATQTLDLGNDVKLELVLIPAGTFTMGTPEPVPVDEEGFHGKIITGKALFALSGGMLLVMLTVIIVQAVRKRQRPKYSLLWLLVMTVLGGCCLLSGLNWRQSVRAFADASAEYVACKARYDAAVAVEKPVHTFTFEQPFYMGRYDVTQEQYQALTGANPSIFKDKDQPAEFVSWDNAQAFCTKLTERMNRIVCLPTDSEWEYACRAGTTTTYYSGDSEADLSKAAWYEANSKNAIHRVGQKEPNVFGLYDMHGNVWQWCQDWHEEKSAGENSQGNAPEIERPLKGGSCWMDSTCCHSAYGIWLESSFRRPDVGFRVVVVPAFNIP